ncbi:MAG: hypothetical protein NW207_03410 [Cytophagales bacterium]|nr:hypothetical protein [Cytophagales bacterium]
MFEGGSVAIAARLKPYEYIEVKKCYRYDTNIPHNIYEIKSHFAAFAPIINY